ncbi:hypothetical protein [Priestia megaterium]|uniref:hypothetical protein n=1 Tax=Priestia megaterium TaxID=1404 RepID=UPI0015A8920B|nr:hypothetical protein [Priestia megaterium]QLC85414.1 hypothetical protein HW576_02290 [Priestia megaterium]
MTMKLTEESFFKVNHEVFDKFCESVEFYTETKKVAKAYQEEREALVHRLETFKKERQDLQEQHIKTVTEMEAFKDNPTEYVYSRMLADEIAAKVKTIDYIIQEMGEEFLQLKVKFFPQFRDAIGKDRGGVSTTFAVYNEAVEKAVNEMIEAGTELRKQVHTDLPADVQEAFNDTIHDERLLQIDWGRYRGGNWTRFFPEMPSIKVSK